MGLSSFFQRKSERTRRPRREAAPLDPSSVEDLRARVRRRFVGAAVLVVVAVVTLPMLLETEPRPLPSNVAINMPAREGMPPVPHERPTMAVPAPAPALSGASAPERPAAPVAVTPKPVVKPSEPARPKPAPEAARAERVEPKPAAPRKPESTTRYVIQVGAYAEAATVKEARQRIEKLGLHSVQQDIDTSGGRRTRVRLGPYATREEADRVVARLRAAGLGAALLAL